MEITLGPFYTCFIATLFLAGFLHIIMHHSSIFFERAVRFSMFGILIILVRMAVPVNFPFTYSIYSHQLLPKLIYFTTVRIGDSNLIIQNLMCMIWITVALILLIRLWIQYIRLRQYISHFYVEDNEKYSHLFELLRSHYKKPMQIAIIPEPISPAVTGLLRPVLILPDTEDFSEKELEYICLHEVAHYKKHHLWFGLLMEIFCRIHWWNPFVQYLKKEFALFLELSNDFFLIHSNPQFDTISYADLIVKTAKKIHQTEYPEPSRMMNFVIDNKSVLSTRVHFILSNHETKQNKRYLRTVICCSLISIAVLLSVFVVPEASFRDLDPVETDGAIEITEDNAYIVDIGNRYSIYVNGKYFGDIDYIPDEFKNIPIYKEGEPIYEK